MIKGEFPSNTGWKVKFSKGAWEQGWEQPSLVLQLGYLVRTLNLVYSHVEKKIIPNLDFGVRGSKYKK